MPDPSDAHARTTAAAIVRAARRVQRRVAAQGGVAWALRAAGPALLAVAGASLVAEFGGLTRGQWMASAVAAGGLVALATALGAWVRRRRLDTVSAAQRLDRTAGLDDRLSSAVAFVEAASAGGGELGPWQAAAVNDAAGRLDAVDARAAAPWRGPSLSAVATLVVGLAALGGAAAFTWAVPEGEGRALRPLPLAGVGAPTIAEREVPLDPRDRERLERFAEELETLIAALDALDEQADDADETDETEPTDGADAPLDEAGGGDGKPGGTDDPVRELLKDARELARGLSEGAVGPDEAAAELAELKARFERWEASVDEGFRATADALTGAAEAAAKAGGKPSKAERRRRASAAEARAEAQAKAGEARASGKAGDRPEDGGERAGGADDPNRKRAGEAVDEALEAMREEAWAKAAKALEEAAKAMREGRLDKREQQRLSKQLDRLGEGLGTKASKERERLRKDRDRLRNKRDEQPDRFSQRERDRLRKTERRLEQLNRQQAARSEARRRLERLERPTKRAADELKRRQRDDTKDQAARDRAAEELRRAAEELRRMARRQGERRQARVARGRVVDMEEMMRRGQRGRGRSGQSGQSGRSGQSGHSGQSGAGGDALERFHRLAEGGQPAGQAGGKDAAGKDAAGKGGDGAGQKPGQLGDGGELVLLDEGSGGTRRPSSGQGGGGTLGDGDGGGEQAQAGPAGGGSAPGEGHDPNLMGEATRLEGAAFAESRVDGLDGEGPSRTQVLRAAADRGFRSKAYRRVHQDYQGVTEEQMYRQEIPAGSRRYVRRYFELIRPR